MRWYTSFTSFSTEALSLGLRTRAATRVVLLCSVHCMINSKDRFVTAAFADRCLHVIALDRQGDAAKIFKA